MVDRDTRGVLIALIPNRRRNSAVPCDFGSNEIVQFCRQNAGLHQSAHIVQNDRRNPARFAHARKIGIFIDANAVFGDPASDIVHSANPFAFGDK
jgi:hypothetical protein